MGKWEWSVTENRGEVMGKEVTRELWAMRMEGQGWREEWKKAQSSRNKIPHMTRMKSREDREFPGCEQRLTKAKKRGKVTALVFVSLQIFSLCSKGLAAAISRAAPAVKQSHDSSRLKNLIHLLKHKGDVGTTLRRAHTQHLPLKSYINQLRYIADDNETFRDFVWGKKVLQFSWHSGGFFLLRIPVWLDAF